MGIGLLTLAGVVTFYLWKRNRPPPPNPAGAQPYLEEYIKERIQQGHHQKMRSIYEKILATDPDNPEAKKALEEISRALGQP